MDQRIFLPADIVLERFLARTGTPIADLVGRDQTRDISRRRQECMWLLRQLTTATMGQIGAMLGGRSAPTVDEGVDRVSMRAANDPDYRNALVVLRSEIGMPVAAPSARLDLCRAMVVGILSDRSLSDDDACTAASQLLSAATYTPERTSK